MTNDKADEVVEERFQAFLSRYQIGLEISIRRPVYNVPSVAIRLSICALVAFFLYTLK